ncbi:MAG: hypothetical protein M3096_08305 [Actinomycetia bacterium]|nr:hypothetical protein [Actinomycetes bacterium]
MRRIGTIVLISGGIVLLLFGYLMSAPWGSLRVADSDPVFVGAPIFFILGIISMLSSAVFYELLPD